MTAGEGDARNGEIPEEAEVPDSCDASVLPEPAEETDPDPNKMPVHAPPSCPTGLVIIPAAGEWESPPVSCC